MAGKTKSEKTFDCVQYKRQVQAAIYDEIKGMTHEQEIAYFQQQADSSALGQWWKRVNARCEVGPSQPG
jgi:hypothetical protein